MIITCSFVSKSIHYPIAPFLFTVEVLPPVPFFNFSSVYLTIHKPLTVHHHSHSIVLILSFPSLIYNRHSIPSFSRRIKLFCSRSSVPL